MILVQGFFWIISWTKCWFRMDLVCLYVFFIRCCRTVKVSTWCACGKKTSTAKHLFFLQARLYSLQADPATYCNEPDGKTVKRCKASNRVLDCSYAMIANPFRPIFNWIQYREISLDSLNPIVILLILDGEIPLVLAVVRWEMFLNCWTFCPGVSTLKVLRTDIQPYPYPSLLLNNWAFRSCFFNTQAWHYHLLVNLFTCGMFQMGVFWAFHDFPSLLSTLPQLFLNMLQASKSDWVHIC